MKSQTRLDQVFGLHGDVYDGGEYPVSYVDTTGSFGFILRV